jgi:hypothetical protein
LVKRPGKKENGKLRMREKGKEKCAELGRVKGSYIQLSLTHSLSLSLAGIEPPKEIQTGRG